MMFLSQLVFSLSASAIILQCLCRINITKRMAKAYVLIWTAAFCLTQVHEQSNSVPPRWSLFVLVLDLSLVLRLGTSFATCLMGGALLWVVLLHIEVEFRFGLLDMPGSMPKSYRVSNVQSKCACTDPPCRWGVNWMVLDSLAICLILMIDFIATHGFAEEAEKEHAAMARTIETVEAAAQLLAGYDVDTVSELLDAAEGRLAPAMHAALRGLEHNLRSYRPYLPAALFERVAGEAGDEESRPVVPIAAPESAEATVVFTDIRASTSVWEAAPEAMQKAIRTHNAVMREALSLFGGYEVKTIGDAFMAAFEGPCAGVDFGLAVQEALLAAEWPAALLEVPICRRTGLWGGLTVRVGVNHGPVMAELNTLTGRVDYFGHTVNVASRLESTCTPGAVAVPSAVWSQVSGACAPAVASAEVLTELKGVSEAVPVRHVWPAGLAGRRRKRLSRASPDDTDDDSATSKHSGSAKSLTQNHFYRRDFGDLSEKRATVGVVSFATVVDNASAKPINDCLEAFVPLLQQSRGTLVSLLGEHVFAGWNLSQAVSVHAENAAHFVRRALRVQLIEHMTAGLATGTVYHGDVGTRSQRFMTVTGPAVSTSLLVWRTAREAGQRFLYTPGAGAVPGGALQAALQASTLALRKSAASLGALYELHERVAVDVMDEPMNRIQLD